MKNKLSKMILENPIIVNELSSELLNKAADKRTKQLSKLYKKNTPGAGKVKETFPKSARVAEAIHNDKKIINHRYNLMDIDFHNKQFKNAKDELNKKRAKEANRSIDDIAADPRGFDQSPEDKRYDESFEQANKAYKAALGTLRSKASSSDVVDQVNRQINKFRNGADARKTLENIKSKKK